MPASRRHATGRKTKDRIKSAEANQRPFLCFTGVAMLNQDLCHDLNGDREASEREERGRFPGLEEHADYYGFRFLPGFDQTAVRQ